MDLISFYKKCLSDLLLVERPTSIMQKVIDTIQSSEERIYMYDVTKRYATLFLSGEMRTVYLYPDLTCSLLKPPPKPTIPHWSNYMYSNHTNHTLDIKWLYDILQQEPVYKKDKEIVEDFINGTPYTVEPEQDPYEPKQDPYEPKHNIYEPVQDLYEPDYDLYEPEHNIYEPEHIIYKGKDSIEYKSDSPDYGPDFGPDLGKEFDFTFGDELFSKQVEKEPIKEPTKKLKTIVKKIMKQPIWK